MVKALRGSARLSAAFGLAALGCFGSPTPLAPSLRGSVGLPHQGVLTDAVELPLIGPGFARYRPFGSRNYGTPLLVGAITRAAAKVEQDAPGGKALVVGDLSARSGGKVSGHASHRTGRDVDLLYYVTTLTNIPVRSPGFIHFGADGLARSASGEYLRLDERRIWLLIRALLTDSEAEVLWIFASRNVEAFVTNYARSMGEPATLIHRAIQVLQEPRDSANHDDHLHVRIACSAAERFAGCESGGPAWAWLRDVETQQVALDYQFDTEPSSDESTAPSDKNLQTRQPGNY
ncbi:MAG TPA: penicillin-insensitive murein endopeptidase [Polyangiaceae bacterium]